MNSYSGLLIPSLQLEDSTRRTMLLGMLVALLAAAATKSLLVLPLLILLAWPLIDNVAYSPKLMLAWCALYAVFADRLAVSSGIGEGSGVLRILPLLTIALTAGLLVVSSQARVSLTKLIRWGGPTFPFLVFGIVLPALGIVRGFPIRTIAAAVVPMSVGCLILLGITAARLTDSTSQVMSLAMLVAAWFLGAYGLAQSLYWQGATLPGLSLLKSWDMQVAEVYDALMLKARMSGSFLNPNVYATAGGILVLYALFSAAPFKRRMAILAPSVVILLLSQSRGITVAIAAAVLVETLARFLPKRIQLRQIANVVVAIALAVSTLVIAQHFLPGFFSNAAERFSTGIRVLFEGIGADRNLAGRLGFWRAAGGVLSQNALGTWGPPESVLGTAIDNDFVRMALQGGIVYVGTYLLFLIWLFSSALPRRVNDAFIRSIAVFIAVVSLTQIPTTYGFFGGAVGVFVGIHIQRISSSNNGVKHLDNEYSP